MFSKRLGMAKTQRWNGLTTLSIPGGDGMSVYIAYQNGYAEAWDTLHSETISLPREVSSSKS